MLVIEQTLVWLRHQPVLRDRLEHLQVGRRVELGAVEPARQQQAEHLGVVQGGDEIGRQLARGLDARRGGDDQRYQSARLGHGLRLRRIGRAIISVHGRMLRPVAHQGTPGVRGRVIGRSACRGRPVDNFGESLPTKYAHELYLVHK